MKIVVLIFVSFVLLVCIVEFGVDFDKILIYLNGLVVECFVGFDVWCSVEGFCFDEGGKLCNLC